MQFWFHWQQLCQILYLYTWIYRQAHQNFCLKRIYTLIWNKTRDLCLNEINEFSEGLSLLANIFFLKIKKHLKKIEISYVNSCQTARPTHSLTCFNLMQTLRRFNMWVTSKPYFEVNQHYIIKATKNISYLT